MKDEKIKPCPFCGGEGNVHEFRTYIEDKHRMGEKYYLTCRDCGIEQMSFLTEKEAIAAWNRRVKDAEND